MAIPKVYDPREEEVRAIRQDIYQSEVKKAMRLPRETAFRDRAGMRLDARAIEAGELNKVRRLIKRAMFMIGTGGVKQAGEMKDGKVTRKGAREGRGRYKDVDHLIRNRQDYEETLAISRKSFFRAVPEKTRKGVRFFVWPMTRGQRIPKGYATLTAARAEAARLSRNADPVKYPSKWWKPMRKKYTRAELAGWLPPKL